DDGSMELRIFSPTKPITRVQIPRIGLDSEVVLARYVRNNGGTWQVPAFKVGHAEFTAGAGEIGNAVLFGHVTSLTVGHVFQDLDKLEVGDEVELVDRQEEYTYRVTEVRSVSRSDVSVLEPT